MKRATTRRVSSASTPTKKGKKEDLPKDLLALAALWKSEGATRKEIQDHLNNNWPDGGITDKPGGKTLWVKVEDMIQDIDEEESERGGGGEDEEEGDLSLFGQSSDFALYYDMVDNKFYGPLSLSALGEDKNKYNMYDATTRKCFEDAEQIGKFDKAENMLQIYAK